MKKKASDHRRKYIREYQRNIRQQKKDAGLVCVMVWVLPEHKEKVAEFESKSQAIARKRGDQND